MAAKRLHCPENHRLAADRTVLFRSPGTGAKAASGGDKDGCGPLKFRHRDSMTGDSGLMKGGSLALSPYHAGLRKWNVNPDSCGKGIFCCSALARSQELSKL
jgi:hypothetical protein